MQLMSAMQAQCPHYMVKADGSDGAVMYDTLQAFCRPGFLTEQSVALGDVIDSTRRQMEDMPQDLVKSTLEMMEKIQKEMVSTSATAVAVASLGASVEASDRQEIKDREEEVAELIAKLKEKSSMKGVAAIKEVSKTSTALATQVNDLGVKIRNVQIPTNLAVPQR